MTHNDEWQKKQHARDQEVARAMIKMAKERGQEQALEVYVSDVVDPETRRGLMDAIRATRELYLSEHETV